MTTISPQREVTRDLVLDAALALFTEKGYFNTSVHDIGRKAHVSIGSIYHHFGDKAGLARALYSALTAHMAQRIGTLERQHGSCHDQARAVVAELFDLTESAPPVMNFMLYARHREFLPDEPPVCSSRPFAMMREMVRRGMASGEIRRMDPLIASTCLFGGPLRMITARLDALLPRPLPDYLDDTWTCAWRAVATS
ncbi:TetR/AcrR family transcriptional regulator [Betaproteobacteria bacterium SCN1]|nr:TetR/AcrR family transcriptional regulator [Betaproteobacteria bacterium SCN1]MBN8759157.1 TetR/AcrR family transcriptional regulator [Thiobacillus sp.]ODU91229.1 MAG: TetR family transcriptional regulator [Thiobacillus sp. SCN 65-179]OJW38131.1 MAG: TetR family transcriptional regulator [Thiobacillus sp. 65-69]